MYMGEPQCLYGCCHDRTHNRFFCIPSTTVINVNLIIVCVLILKTTLQVADKAYELCVWCQAESWHQNVVSKQNKTKQQQQQQKISTPVVVCNSQKQLLPLCLHKCDHNEILVVSFVCNVSIYSF